MMQKKKREVFENGRTCRGRLRALALAALLSAALTAGALAAPALAAAPGGPVAGSGFTKEAAAAAGSVLQDGEAGITEAKNRTESPLANSYRWKKKTRELKLKLSAAKVAVGKTVKVKVSNGGWGTKLTYSSSDTSLATVSSSGKVTAKKVGTVTIKVKAAETYRYKAASKSVKVKIVPAATKSLKAEVQDVGIRLYWEKVAGATGYYVYRNDTKIATIKSGSTVSYTDLKANKKGKTYTYKLVAKADTGTSTLSKKVKIRRNRKGQSSSSTDGDNNSSGGSGNNSSGGSDANPSGGSDSGSSGGNNNDSSGDSGSGSDANPSGGSEGGDSGAQEGTADTSGLGVARYCFEKKYVATTLANSKKGELAVIDTYNVSSSVIKSALNGGVVVYGYLNAGALENTRSYYNTYKNLIIASYEGWEGEYWVDVTKEAWQDHLIDEAKKIKAAGATGIYFDNVDIYYMVQEGFREEGTRLTGTAPTATAVYQALSSVIKTIQTSVGIRVMPNCGETFIDKFIKANPGFIKEVNMESVLYEDNKAHSSKETTYRTKFLDAWKKSGILIRGIEYINTDAGAKKAAEYYSEHGWQSLYVSRHYTLQGD